MIPKFSILMITYNQENVISRSIESLLKQKEFIYEICISDDSSSDKTWDILQDYSVKYPGLFKLNRNSHNKGIFENNEVVGKMPTGDLIYGMAGDDEIGPNWLDNVSAYIAEKRIDYINESICICGNYQCVYPNGDILTNKKNKNVLLNVPAIRLYERGLICPRGCVYSKHILEKTENVSQGKSFIAENAQDCQLFLFANSYFYINVVSNIYYSGIGVSANMTDERKAQHEQTMVYAFEFLKKKNAPLTKKDWNLPQLNIAQKHMRWNPSMRNLLKLTYYIINVFDFYMWYHSFDVKPILFSILRRLPHSKPILW